MGRTVMSNTVQLEGLDLFMFLMERFKMTPEEALEEMKEHNQDVKHAEMFVKLYKKTPNEADNFVNLYNNERGNNETND